MNGTPPIRNINDVPLQNWRHGERYEARMAQIGRQLGAKKLGYRLVVLPPGKVAWPVHTHLVNEEMFFVIEGTGKLRIGEETWPLTAGDVVAIPPGPDTPHQIINDSETDLKYLCVSTMEEPAPMGSSMASQRCAAPCWSKKKATSNPPGSLIRFLFDIYPHKQIY